MMRLQSVVILLEIFVFASLAENESNIVCDDVMSKNSATTNDDTVSVGCPSKYPTMTSCGLVMGDGTKRDGGYIQSNKCYAQNGGGSGVAAMGRCCKFPGTMKCSDKTGTVSGDDQQVAISCPSDYTIFGCAAHCDKSDFDGFFFGTIRPDHWPSYYSAMNRPDPIKPLEPMPLPHDTDQDLVSTCSVQSSGALTTGYARCCKNEVYPMECKMRYGVPGTYSKVGCSTGYTIVGCSAWTLWDNQNAWYILGDKCYAYSGNDNGVWAMAVCCRVLNVTPTPTAITQSPTKKPTISPVCKPCNKAICKQEDEPQPIPMATVNDNMWNYMRMIMVLSGFNIIFICVIIYLCYTRNKKRKYGKVYDFDSQDIENESETN